MQSDRISSSSSISLPGVPAVEDAESQASVLITILEELPAYLTRAELVLLLAGSEPSFAERDQIERAVKELVGSGLLHEHGQLLMPSRAMRVADNLELR